MRMSAKVLAFAASATMVCGAQSLPRKSFVVRDVRVFDGVSVREHQTVVVRDGKIFAVGAAPAGLPVVEGRGRTLLPGLIDAHVHAYPPNALVESLALGVTTDLDMFTPPIVAQSARKREAAGNANGEAALFSAGYLATVPKGHGTEYGLPVPTLTTPAEAQAWVDARVAEGSDYIKIIIDDGTAYGVKLATLDAATVKALIAAAHKRGKIAVCHVGTYADAKECIEAGGDGLAHLFVDRRPDAGFGAFVAGHHAFVIPTLSVLQSITGGPESAELLHDARITDALPDADKVNMGKGFGRPKGVYEAAVESIHQLRDAGVPILAGTDAPNPGTMFGASVHGELLSLTLAGLTPVQALRAATEAPAKAFGLADRGRIAPGMRADLLLVEGDPTKTITDTRNIVGVWKAGVATDRAGYLAGIAKERTAAVAAAHAVPAGAVGAGGVLADFEDGVTSKMGAGWVESTDSVAGGASTVKMKIVAGGAEGTKSALEIVGEIKAGFDYPWAGAMLSPGAATFAPVNLSAAKGITFWTKGDGGTYRVMMFTTGGGQIPASADFVAPAEWTKVTMPWANFSTNGSDVAAILWVGGPKKGAFRFVIDEVTLSK